MKATAMAIVAVTFVTAGSALAQSTRASAVLAPTAGNAVAGTVTFVQNGEVITVEAVVTGLKPGPHGFHLHEKGDCSAPDAQSAGGHYNPSTQPHGDPHLPGHHLGDLPMLTADAGGRARLTAVVTGVSLGRGAADILGKAVVVHADPDDYKSQPAGNSGARVACGVITTAK